MYKEVKLLQLYKQFTYPGVADIDSGEYYGGELGFKFLASF